MYRVRAAQRQLEEWRELQRPLDEGVTGEDIAGILTTLAQVADSRDPPRSKTYRLYWTSGRLFDEKFTKSARWWLYYILVDVIEHLASPATRRTRATRPFWILTDADRQQTRQVIALKRGSV